MGMKKIVQKLTTIFLLVSILPSYVYAKELSQQDNIESDKSWTIRFNTVVDTKTLNEHINITDSKGKIFKTNMIISDDKNKVTLIPKKAYDPNEIYTITVNENIKSARNKYLSEQTTKKFKITEYKINEENEKLIKEFRSHHGYSSDELKNMKIKYIGNVDNYYIYYVPFKDKWYDYQGDFKCQGYSFPAQSQVRIIGSKDGKLYTLGMMIFETSINVKDLYNLLLDEYKDLTKIGSED